MNQVESHVHITAIKAGDTILHRGRLRTVCKQDITTSPFTGLAIFGDSYKMGFEPVKRIDFVRIGAYGQLEPSTKIVGAAI